MQKIILHRTAVASAHHKETVAQPCEPWNGAVAQYVTRLQGICQDINDHYNVENLCREFHGRVEQMVEKDWDRIAK